MSTALDWLRPRRPEPVTQLTTEWARYDGLAGRTPGDVLVPADILAGREGRAGALAGQVPAGAALARDTAVWVHTGGAAPQRVSVVVPVHRRVRGPLRIHRQQLAPGDVEAVGGVPTTTPLRTAVDLVCFAPEAAALSGVRALLDAGLAPAELFRAVEVARAGPVRRAQARLALLVGQDGPAGP